MTDPSEQYQQGRKRSPKDLDDRILAAAQLQAEKNQADKNRESDVGYSWKPSGWMSGAAFACICLVGVMFVIDTDTQQLTDDIEFDVSQSSSDAAANPAFYDISAVADETDSGVQLEEVVVTAMKQQEDTDQGYTSNIQLFSRSAPDVPPVPQQALTAKAAGEIKERRTMEIEKMEMERKREIPVRAERAMRVAEPGFESAPSNFSLAAAPSLIDEEVEFEGNPELNDSDVIGDTPILMNLGQLLPDLILDIRYFGSNNFVGEPVDGYLAPKALISTRAALALANVQLAAQEQGLGLKVFDAYRPQRAVNHFVRWAEDLDDLKTKPVYYPNVEKSELFAKGYIAARSGHSRASTVDLTLVDLETGQELDMGSLFDFFDPVSWPSSEAVSEQAQENRQLLRKLMLDHGFKPYEAEWWHFTLKDEPYPDQYFDIPIE